MKNFKRAPILQQRLAVPAMISDAGIGELDFGGVLTSDAIARDGNVWVTAGMDTSRFMATKTINFDHDSAQPVAQLTQLIKESGHIRFRAKFPPPGTSAKADEVRGLVKSGVINSLSAAIVPIEMEPLKDKRGRQVGWRITRSDLVDFAIVSSPSNADCLIDQRSSKRAGKVISKVTGAHISAIADHAEQIAGRCRAVLASNDPTGSDADAGGDGAGDPEDEAAARRRRQAHALRLRYQLEDQRHKRPVTRLSIEARRREAAALKATK